MVRGLRVVADSRNKFSDIPDWLATQPLFTGSRGLSSQMTPAVRVGSSSSSTAAAGAVGCSGASVAWADCCGTVVAVGGAGASVAAGGGVFSGVAAGDPQAIARASNRANAPGIIYLILCVIILGKTILRMGFDGPIPISGSRGNRWAARWVGEGATAARTGRCPARVQLMMNRAGDSCAFLPESLPPYCLEGLGRFEA